MAKFEKGQSGNIKGRPKGTRNKLTKELRILLKNIIAQELEEIPNHLSKLEPKDRLDVVLKLMGFILPKVETISCTQDDPVDLSFDIL